MSSNGHGGRRLPAGRGARVRGADPMSEQPRLHHLLDRLRHGVLLEAEAEQLARLVGELERERDTLQAVCESNKRAYVGAVKSAQTAEDERALDNVAMRAVARQRDEADARVTALEAEVVRLTAGQCTHTRRMCDLHHQKPVADCPYPKCKTARAATA